MSDFAFRVEATLQNLRKIDKHNKVLVDSCRKEVFYLYVWRIIQF